MCAGGSDGVVEVELWAAMGLLYPLSIGAILAAFAFVTLSLASGLLYISELIEEHSRYAKVIGQRGIYTILLLHVLLYFTDSLPPAQTAFSITCHLVYLQNFSQTWPLISLSSVPFLASCVLVIVNHFSWFFYFSNLTHETRRMRSYHGLPTLPTYGFAEIASFFATCVWLAPLFLFLSLSANDNALPTSAAADPSGFGGTSNPQPGRVSLFRSIFSFVPLENIFNLKRKKTQSTASDGLITPASPIVPLSPRVHHHPPSALDPSRTGTPPPQYSPAYFSLSSPPARRGTGDQCNSSIRLARRGYTSVSSTTDS